MVFKLLQKNLKNSFYIDLDEVAMPLVSILITLKNFHLLFSNCSDR